MVPLPTSTVSQLMTDRHEPPAQDASTLELAIGSEALDRYEAALHRLKPNERELIVARCELDFSAAEIATIFGKGSADAARMAVARALVRLAEEMRNA